MTPKRLFTVLLALLVVGCGNRQTKEDPEAYVQAMKLEKTQPVPTIITKPKLIAAHQLKTFSNDDRVSYSSKKLPYQVIEAANAAATHKPDHYGYFNSIMQYDYAEGALYQVFCAPFKITDIRLQAGEELQGKPGIGDPVRWKAGTSFSIEAGKRIQHLYIKPTRPGYDTSLVLTTNRRTYYLELHSYKTTHMSSVSWNYAQDEIDLYSSEAATIENENALIKESMVDISKANFNYSVDTEEGAPLWKPVRVFDNGKKTYIQFSDALAVSEAPALFVLKDDDLQMVNYRVKENFYIVDRLFDQAELRIIQPDSEEIVVITNNSGRS